MIKMIKAFIEMKYEQWLMRLYDWVCNRLKNTRSEWYIGFSNRVEIYKLEDDLADCERRCNQLEYYLIDADDRIEKLRSALAFYEDIEEEEAK